MLPGWGVSVILMSNKHEIKSVERLEDFLTSPTKWVIGKLKQGKYPDFNYLFSFNKCEWIMLKRDNHSEIFLIDIKHRQTTYAIYPNVKQYYRIIHNTPWNLDEEQRNNYIAFGLNYHTMNVPINNVLEELKKLNYKEKK